MSAVDIFIDPTRAVVLTDAASYDEEGRLVHIGRKCDEVPGRKMVVAARGPMWFGPALARTLKDWSRDIDHVEVEGEEMILQCMEAARHLLGRKPALDIFIVGWSDVEDRAKCAQFTTVPPEGVERFSMVESVLSPELSPRAEARVVAATGRAKNGTIDYTKLGRNLMEEQRRVQGEIFAPGQFLVGGHVLRTDVTASGITQAVIHRWAEDSIGRRIRPQARVDNRFAPNVAAPVFGGNRADRRRAKAQGRLVG